MIKLGDLELKFANSKASLEYFVFQTGNFQPQRVVDIAETILLKLQLHSLGMHLLNLRLHLPDLLLIAGFNLA